MAIISWCSRRPSSRTTSSSSFRTPGPFSTREFPGLSHQHRRRVLRHPRSVHRLQAIRRSRRSRPNLPPADPPRRLLFTMRPRLQLRPRANRYHLSSLHHLHSTTTSPPRRRRSYQLQASITHLLQRDRASRRRPRSLSLPRGHIILPADRAHRILLTSPNQAVPGIRPPLRPS